MVTDRQSVWTVEDSQTEIVDISHGKASRRSRQSERDVSRSDSQTINVSQTKIVGISHGDAGQEGVAVPVADLLGTVAYFSKVQGQ